MFSNEVEETNAKFMMTSIWKKNVGLHDLDNNISA